MDPEDRLDEAKKQSTLAHNELHDEDRDDLPDGLLEEIASISTDLAHVVDGLRDESVDHRPSPRSEAGEVEDDDDGTEPFPSTGYPADEEDSNPDDGSADAVLGDAFIDAQSNLGVFAAAREDGMAGKARISLGAAPETEYYDASIYIEGSGEFAGDGDYKVGFRLSLGQALALRDRLDEKLALWDLEDDVDG